MSDVSWAEVVQFLLFVFALIGALGVLVQMRLHAVQIRREQLEIRKLERSPEEPDAESEPDG